MHCYVDQTLCIRCGKCESSKMFKVDNLGNYQFFLPEIKDNQKDTVRSVKKCCPVDAIIVEE